MAATKEKAKTAAEVRAEKYPEMVSMYGKLESEKAKLQAKSAPIRKKRDAIEAKAQDLLAEIRELNAQIHKIERPRLGEIDSQLGRLASAMGGRTMSQANVPSE